MRITIAETNWTTITLSHRLIQTGQPVTRCESAEEAEEYARMGQQDVIVADAGLNAETRAGLYAAAGATPVCLLSADGDAARTAALLGEGAADVIDASAPDELITAKLLSVARRALGAAQPRIERGPLSVDVMRRRAYLNDHPMALPPKLYETLEHLALRPDSVVSKAQLLSHVYAQEDEPSERVFDVYICKLRSALATADGGVGIVTARTRGYLLCHGEGHLHDTAPAFA
ncbi:response regulator transcription factor [Aestuariicoccus sp. MJ-SS9]|uniref:winged helix-turn-helix transcriptional regulator n=1 Tax=Aestuariicoccus sp. MJ-SS9 TaxID=3079855 RepID=UPI002909A2EC|nr:response regulator transcription factor [Aestuariicoccus sp. MJ-SS9]MDU8911798.1 response regulator transcription factor [Aestuariicoccus sp. MJ-SS9]